MSSEAEPYRIGDLDALLVALVAEGTPNKLLPNLSLVKVKVTIALVASVAAFRAVVVVSEVVTGVTEVGMAAEEVSATRAVVALVVVLRLALRLVLAVVVMAAAVVARWWRWRTRVKK